MADSNESNIRVVLRVRPKNSKEISSGAASIVDVANESELHLQGPEPRTFTYDYVASSSCSQEDVFNAAAKPITESCLAGYNGTVFVRNSPHN